METTLIQELDQAANRIDCICCSRGERCPRTEGGETCRRHDVAARLRQRAAWVRELERRGIASAAWLWDALTGPIPSETAPAAECAKP
jgi:hypothetical protein